MIGDCETCDRKQVPIARSNFNGRPFACFICQGDVADPYCELENETSGLSPGTENNAAKCTCEFVKDDMGTPRIAICAACSVSQERAPQTYEPARRK